MTSTETGLLVGALVGLLGALQAWLVSRTLTHGSQLNGLMTPRIAKTAAAVVAADHLARGDKSTLDTSATRNVDVTALAEALAALNKPTATPVP